MLQVDLCFSPELLALYHLPGKIVVVVDILRATSSIVTALANGVTHVFPVAELAECRALGEEHGCLTAAERDGRAAAGFDLGNSPFGYLDGVVDVKGRAVVISTTNGTHALRRSLAADAVVVGAFLNLQAVVEFAEAQQKDVLVVCAGWKGQFCLEDTVFGGALAARLAHSGFDVTSSDATLAALHLWERAQVDLPAYLLQSSHVRRLNSLEANKDFAFCLQLDAYPHTLPLWRTDRLVLN